MRIDRYLLTSGEESGTYVPEWKICISRNCGERKKIPTRKPKAENRAGIITIKDFSTLKVLCNRIYANLP